MPRNLPKINQAVRHNREVFMPGTDGDDEARLATALAGDPAAYQRLTDRKAIENFDAPEGTENKEPEASDEQGEGAPAPTSGGNKESGKSAGGAKTR